MNYSIIEFEAGEFAPSNADEKRVADLRLALVQENCELADPDGPGTCLPPQIIMNLGSLMDARVGRIFVPHAGLQQSRHDTFPRPYED